MRITTVGDISGQITAAHGNADAATVACVCLPSGALRHIRKRIPKGFPKWRDACDEHVDLAVSLVLSESLGCSAASVDKASENWGTFWSDAHDVHSQTASLAGGSISFVKAANLIKYLLFSQAATVAFGQAIKAGTIPSSLRSQGKLKVTESLIFDNEIEGVENVDAFAEIWRSTNSHQPLTLSLGIQRVVETMRLTTEQVEPLLLLPDYVAGVIQAANSRANTLARSKVTPAFALRIRDRLSKHPAFTEFDDPVSMQYEEILPEFKKYIRRHAA